MSPTMGGEQHSPFVGRTIARWRGCIELALTGPNKSSGRVGG
jgi:hypothetical protein